MIQGQPNVTSTWLDGRVRPGPQPGLLAKAWRWMPALLLTTVSVCSYLSVVLLVLFPVAGPSPVVGFDSHLDGLSPSAALTLLLVYHALVALAAVSFITTVRLPPGTIPLWLNSREPGDQAYFHNVLQAVEKKLDGSLRFCRKCGAFKPDHAHHSHEFGQCVLAYQHWGLYCNNAIGFYNYKTYMLALLYVGAVHLLAATLFLPGVVSASYNAATRGQGVAGWWEVSLAVLMTLQDDGSGAEYACAWSNLVVSGVISGCALYWFAFHLALISQGLTAPSLLRKVGCARNKPPKPPLQGQPFDFGPRGNLARVFGRHPFLWLLPTNQSIVGNGIFFENASPNPGDKAFYVDERRGFV